MKYLSLIVLGCIASFSLTNCKSVSGGSSRRLVTNTPALSPSIKTDVPAPAPTPQTENAKSRGGVIEGNGGEYITTERNPWFLGGPVKYCIKQDPATFSLSSDQARTAIAKVFQTWNSILKPMYRWNQMEAPLLLAAKGVLWLAIDFNEVDCSQAHELEFQLGTFDKSIETALSYRAKDILALSLRDQYSDQTGRSKGRIWIAPDKGDRAYKGPNPGAGFWGMKQNFHNVLMHELGHVFGIPHLEFGFMAANFPARVIEFGLDAQVTGISLEPKFGMCGVIPKQEPPSKKFMQIFGIEEGNVKEVCFRGAHNSTVPEFQIEGADQDEFVFNLKDGTQLVFPAVVTRGMGGFVRIGGQYLAQNKGAEPRYVPWTFFDVYQASYDQGLIRVGEKTYPLLVVTVKPGLTNLELGLAEGWQSFYFAQDAPEVIPMALLPDPSVE